MSQGLAPGAKFSMVKLASPLAVLGWVDVVIKPSKPLSNVPELERILGSFEADGSGVASVGVLSTGLDTGVLSTGFDTGVLSTGFDTGVLSTGLETGTSPVGTVGGAVGTTGGDEGLAPATTTLPSLAPQPAKAKKSKLKLKRLGIFKVILAY